MKRFLVVVVVLTILLGGCGSNKAKVLALRNGHYNNGFYYAQLINEADRKAINITINVVAEDNKGAALGVASLAVAEVSPRETKDVAVGPFVGLSSTPTTFQSTVRYEYER